jgi:uncharacterized protein
MRLLIAHARSLSGYSRSTLRRVGFVLLALFGAALLAAPVAAQTWQTGTDGLLPIPPLSAHVTDLTQTLSAQETQALEAKLADWEARTTNQLAVLLVPTTQPEPIEAYAIRVAEKWQIGRKGKDNGLLFLVAKNDKKMRIEVGYGLEGVLTDATSRRIIAESVAPLFREGKFAAGIDAGVDRVISTVAEGKPLPPREASNVNVKPSGRHFDFGTMLLILFIIVPIVGSVLRSIFSRLLGSTVGAGIVGAAACSSQVHLIAGIAAIVNFRDDLRRCGVDDYGRRGGSFYRVGLAVGLADGGIGGGGGWSGGGGTSRRVRWLGLGLF